MGLIGAPAAELNGLSSDLTVTAAQRRMRMNAQVKAGAQTAAHGDTNGASSRGINLGPMTPAAEMTLLETHQKSKGMPSTITISYQARRSDCHKTTDANLGTSCMTYNDSLTMLG